MYAAVLDACALVPVSLADTLLRIAEHGLYRPLWSEQLLLRCAGCHSAGPSGHRPGCSGPAVRCHARLLSGCDGYRMGTARRRLPASRPRRSARPGCCCSRQRPSDRHRGLKDFPAQILDPFDIEAIHPDDFLGHQLELAPELVLQAIREQAAATATPPLSIAALLQILERAGSPTFAAACREQLTTDDPSSDPDPAED